MVFDSDASPAYGYLGLGSNNQSEVDAQFSDWSSASFIQRVLGESSNNTYYTLLLSPSPSDYGTDLSLGGVLTIGEIVDLAAVFNLTTPVPIDLTEVISRPILQFNGRQDIVISGLVGPNGPIKLTSNSKVDAGSTTGYIDSTQPSILVNPEVAEAIYSSVSGAQYSSDDGLWHLPCTQLNATFTISGYEYPISPLNMLIPGNDSCIGTVCPSLSHRRPYIIYSLNLTVSS